MGGRFHVKIDMRLRPAANKYLEGKMNRSLKREFKELEFAEWKASGKRQWLVRRLFVFRFATCLHAVRVVDKDYNNGASSGIVSSS